LQISLGELALGNTELSGTIEIGTATGNGTDITGFTIDGGLIDASDVTGPLNLTGASAIPLDVDPSINLVTAGNFDASEVGVSINDGIAEVPLLGLVFDFSTDPIEGPGNGTGTIVVNSVSGSDYDLTVSIPVAIELEAAPGAIASISGTIVASGVITVAPDPAEIMSGFYSEIKGLIGSDDVLGGLIVDAKSAIDSGDTSLRGQVYVDIQTATAALSADAVSAFDTISAGIVDTEELNYLYYTVTVVIAELESLRDFLSGALASPASYQSLTLNEFFADAERAVQEEVFGVGVIV